MPQSKLIILGLVAVVVLGGAYAALKPKEGIAPTVNEETESQTATSENVPAESGKKMAFSEFIKQGGSYKCTVNQSVQGSETEGITYIDDEMIRGEYTVKTQGMEIDSNMIVRDGFAYSWSSMMPSMGFKSKVATDVDQNTGAGASGTYSWNAEQIGDYSCEAWDADPSVFELPTTVTFTEAR